MFEVRFHGRGGQGAKTASQILGTAAFLEDMQVQDFPIYGAERRGAPVVAFTRINKHTIGTRGYIFKPDMAVVLDDSLLTLPGVNAAAGLEKGKTLLVNTTKRSEEIKKITNTVAKVIAIDVTSIALSIIGKPIVNTAILGAVVKASGVVKLESLEKAIREELSDKINQPDVLEKNVQAAAKCFELLEV